MTKPELLGRLDTNMHRIQVLLANGDRRRKSALKVSNQEYPRLRSMAVDHLMTQTVYLVAVRNVLERPSSLYAKDVNAEINAEAERLIELLRDPGGNDDA